MAAPGIIPSMDLFEKDRTKDKNRIKLNIIGTKILIQKCVSVDCRRQPVIS